MQLDPQGSFFDRVVTASGLPSLIARAAITRACSRAGVDATQLDRTGLKRALPHIEATLRLFLPTEVEERLHDLRALIR